MLIRAVGGVARAHLIIYQGEKNTRSTVIGLRKPEDGPGVCLDERRYPRVLGGHFIGGYHFHNLSFSLFNGSQQCFKFYVVMLHMRLTRPPQRTTSQTEVTVPIVSSILYCKRYAWQ